MGIRLSISIRYLFGFLLLLIASIFAFGQSADLASIPRLVKYTGTSPAGMSSVTFAIYDREDALAPLWLETQNVTADDSGHYAVLLGATKSDGLPSSIFASGEARWIGVKVGDQPEGTRTLLVSVPYALKAGDAETLGGKPLSAFLLADTGVTAGGKAQRLNSGLEGDKAAPERNAPGDSGSQNFLAKFASDGVTLNNSQVFDNGTNVGIGTTSPGAKLDVAGTIRSTNTSDSVNSSTGAITTLGGLGVAQTGYFGNGIVLESQNAASFVYGTSGFATRGSSLASSAGTSTNYNGTFFNNNGIGAGDNGAQKNVGLPSWRMALGGGGAEWNGADNFTVARVAAGGNFLAPTVLFKLTSTGSVGIGTASPAEMLDVSGRIRSSDTTDSGGIGTGSIYTLGGISAAKTGYFGSGIVLESQNAASFVYGTAGSSTKGSSLSSSGGTSGNYNGAFFNSNGIGAGDNGAQKNVGLPSWRMALGGGSAEWNGADNFTIGRVAAGGNFTSPTAFLKVTSAGNVGIGTTTPSTSLDVAGNIHTTGTIFFNDGSQQSAAGVSQVIPSQGLTATVLSNKLSVGLQTCTNGQVLQSTGSAWACAAAGSGGTLTGVTTGANSGLTGGGTSGTLNLSLLTSCTTNQFLAWSGTAWQCTTPAGNGGLTLPFTGNATNSTAAFTVNQHGTGVTNPDPLTNLPPAAILGFADSGTGFTIGLFGKSTSPNGLGVLGIVTGGPTQENSAAVIGIATATTGKAQGVSGQSSSPDGVGGEFSNDSNTGTALRASVGPQGDQSSITEFEVSGLGINLNAANINIQGNGAPNANIQLGGTVTVQGGALVANNGLQANNISGPGGTLQVNGSLNVSGNFHVNGSISKGSGTFMIDHPLDPAGKYLYHSFVESPDMMNIYNGVVMLDAKGQAWITMPDYFEALNMDFRYQLTAIGRPAPGLYVKREMAANKFLVSGGPANGKVSWQVTGIRHDAYADAHRVQVEVEKPAAERGTYLYPELFAKPGSDKVADNHK